MKFVSRLWLRKRQIRNPSLASESSDCCRERRTEFDVEAGEGETEEGSSEIKRDLDLELELEESFSERNRRMESPPIDDCCPICFGTFTVPCRAPCGHWYCGDCILQYWNHGAALKPCKCPMCSQLITRLIPEASFDCCKDVEVLENVRKYNRIFVGGIYGFMLKVLELPLLIKRIFRQMMDPDAADSHLVKVRIFAMLLGALYAMSPLDFLPTERINAVRLFDNFAIALVTSLYGVGLYRRWRRMRHVRQLAAAQL